MSYIARRLCAGACIGAAGAGLMLATYEPAQRTTRTLAMIGKGAFRYRRDVRPFDQVLQAKKLVVEAQEGDEGEEAQPTLLKAQPVAQVAQDGQDGQEAQEGQNEVDAQKAQEELEEAKLARTTALRAWQKVAAEDLLVLCIAHGGTYVKFGQYLSTMKRVFPDEVVDTMAPLQDNAGCMAPAAARRVLQEELGDTDELFSEFDPDPIAAASLCQVHAARLRQGGQKVAVKIQREGLAARVQADLDSFALINGCLRWAFPSIDYGFLLPEFQETVSRELDFTTEARNSERVRAMFAAHPEVVVPRVLRATRRVLVMEFKEGVRINEVAELRRRGLDPARVAHALVTAFGRQVHVHGFVQLDPHPGNVLVECLPHGQFRLVLLDHGMYRRLRPSFRRAHSKLWHCLLTGDDAGGRQALRELGVDAGEDDKRYEALSLVLAHRPVGGTPGGTMAPETRARLRETAKEVSAEEINAFVAALPRDLLFVLRGNSIIRGVNAGLGGTGAQRFAATLTTILEGGCVPWTDADAANSPDFHAAVAFERALAAGYPTRAQAWRLWTRLAAVKVTVRTVSMLLAINSHISCYCASVTQFITRLHAMLGGTGQLHGPPLLLAAAS